MNDRVEAALAPTYRFLRRVRRRLRLVRWAARNRRELARMRSNNDERSSQLASALAAAIADRMTEKERQSTARLERARADLERSPVRLPWVRRTYSRGPIARRFASRATVGWTARYASVHAPWGRLLLTLVGATRPPYVLELGTAIGISGAYMSIALALHGGGRLVTFDADSERGTHARWLFDHLGLDNVDRRVEWITQDALADVFGSIGPPAFVYVDALKDPDPLLELHRWLSERALPNAVIVYDDVNWSPELVAAWRSLREEPSVAISIDLGRMGIVVVQGPRRAHTRFSLRVC